MNFKISDHVLADCEFEASKRFNKVRRAHTHGVCNTHSKCSTSTSALQCANFELIISLFLAPGILIYVCSSK